MRIFISGGCKNGKSHYALKLAAMIGRPAYYIATMIPADGEDDDRIKRHVSEREGFGFETVEIYRDIHELPESCDLNGSFLLDSVTALLANEMFPGDYIEDAYKKTAGDLIKLINKTPNIVIVSDYIYSDAFVYDAMTENYRYGLGFADRACASVCDVVLEVAFANVTVQKNTKGFKELYEKVF